MLGADASTAIAVSGLPPAWSAAVALFRSLSPASLAYGLGLDPLRLPCNLVDQVLAFMADQFGQIALWFLDDLPNASEVLDALRDDVAKRRAMHSPDRCAHGRGTGELGTTLPWSAVLPISARRIASPAAGPQSQSPQHPPAATGTD